MKIPVSWAAWSRVGACLLLAWAVLAPRAASAQHATRPPEHAVKAEFIERFTMFIDWPPLALPPGSPFVICIAGNGPLRAPLERLVSSRPIKQRPARLLLIDDGTPVDRCHLLYIAPSQPPVLTALLRRTAGRPLLTVGDTAGWGARGVIINLFVDERAYVRFEINLEGASAAGLKVSAKLLRLARTVYGAK